MHPKVKGVGFTGSTNGGMALYRLATQRKEPIPVFAEMGSINPVIVLTICLGTKKGPNGRPNTQGPLCWERGNFAPNPGLILGIKGPSMDNFVTALRF